MTSRIPRALALLLLLCLPLQALGQSEPRLPADELEAARSWHQQRARTGEATIHVGYGFTATAGSFAPSTWGMSWLLGGPASQFLLFGGQATTLDANKVARITLARHGRRVPVGDAVVGSILSIGGFTTSMVGTLPLVITGVQEKHVDALLVPTLAATGVGLLMAMVATAPITRDRRRLQRAFDEEIERARDAESEIVPATGRPVARVSLGAGGLLLRW